MSDHDEEAHSEKTFSEKHVRKELIDVQKGAFYQELTEDVEFKVRQGFSYKKIKNWFEFSNEIKFCFSPNLQCESGARLYEWNKNGKKMYLANNHHLYCYDAGHLIKAVDQDGFIFWDYKNEDNQIYDGPPKKMKYVRNGAKSSESKSIKTDEPFVCNIPRVYDNCFDQLNQECVFISLEGQKKACQNLDELDDLEFYFYKPDDNYLYEVKTNKHPQTRYMADNHVLYELDANDCLIPSIFDGREQHWAVGEW